MFLRFNFSFSFSSKIFIFLRSRENFVSITTPLSDGEAFKEASFTSPALSPKIALSNFSSGVGSVSPLGVILPIRISPSLISAPILMIPFSSRFFTLLHLRLESQKSILLHLVLYLLLQVKLINVNRCKTSL